MISSPTGTDSAPARSQAGHQAITPAAHGWLWPSLLGAGSLLILALLLWRNHGLYPYVFADELVYSTYSRLAPMGESIVPSYLYFWLFGASSACGAGFLECVRIGNAILFIASAPFLYLSARTVCGKPASAAVALLALGGPVNIYTAYFMPEATYFFGFSVLAWVSLKYAAGNWLRLGLAGGLVLGLMSLLKVHALFLIPAQCLFAIGALYLAGGPWLRRGCAAAALTVAVALAVRFGLGFLLAGPAGLHLFGPLYGDHAGGSAGRMLGYMPFAWASLQGHLMGLALMFTFPVAVAAYTVFDRQAARAQERAVTALQLYAVLTLGASMGLAVLYTASLYSVEGLRIHARYYNFTFPLLFMVAAAALRAPPLERRWLPAGLLAAGGVAAVLYALARLGTAFRVLVVDGAEAGSLIRSGDSLYLLAGVQVLVLAAWLLRARLATLLYLGLFLPLFAWITIDVVNEFVSHQRHPSVYDKAGQFARARLAPADLAQLTITGAATGDLMRTKFHLDAPAARLTAMADGVPLDLSHAPANSKWLLVVGTHALPAQLPPFAAEPGYTLVRLPDPAHEIGSIDFRSPVRPSDWLASVEGMSHPELWGRWSDGPHVRIRLARPLPRRLVLVLGARAFGPNVGKDFILRVGRQERRFKLEESDRERSLRFDTDGSERELTIIVPEPARPTVDGKVVDGRSLGLGINEIRIATPHLPRP